ncbi:hypothetical protein MPH_01239 [Macrophomina phaseolina MS6]|uniref:BAH domain-containing protein n=1 Tax=Macrophomina phaseolina (strain MS6) TaxID=1126212 RepID=K2RFY2_MACPH|nr:hypothetical protein MPH_01239 [Macrophomina phaseolina MS6]
MTAAQVHQWIVDNIHGYDIHNTTHRSSIAATLSQQKAKFPKADAVMEGSRQLSRWRLAPEYVSAYKNELKNHRERLRRERELQGVRNGLVSRRKEFNEFAKSSHTAPDSSDRRPASQHKDISSLPPPSTETPMFIQRHRVAYDDDGRDIVAGFKDVPIERWTELAKAESFRTKGLRFYVGDYIKAPLPNRFKFADYTHKPLVQTIAQIEEIRQRRDASGYAVLVQWFVTKEAAEWWKCRHVKSLWPKDEKTGSYVPATVWDVLTSDFIIEQEKLDPEETKRRIIPNLFFELDTDVWLLYLKQGQGPEIWPGIAFGPQSPRSAEKETENTEAGLERTIERSGSASRNSTLSQAWTATQSQITLRTKAMAEANQPQKKLPHDDLAGSQQISKARNRAFISPALMVEAVPISSEQAPPKQPPLSRVLFTPSPINDQVEKDSSATDFRRSKNVSKPDRKMPRSAPEAPMKRQKRGVTPEEQAAVRAFLLEEQANAEYRTKDLFAAVPELDPDNAAWDREAKIAEIKARPSRKARFTNNLTYARLERPSHTFFKEVDRPLPKAYKAPPSSRPGSGYSDHAVTDLTTRSNGRRASLSNPDMDMQDAPYTQSSTTNGTSSSQFDPNKPEMFDTVEELLNLPSNLVPTLYEGRLAFRDGTVGANGRLPRAKKVFKVEGTCRES